MTLNSNDLKTHKFISILQNTSKTKTRINACKSMKVLELIFN